MSIERELNDLRTQAARVAERIRQNDIDSPRALGGFQNKILSNLRPHGPDPHLRDIEGTIANLVIAIDAYLMAG